MFFALFCTSECSIAGGIFDEKLLRSFLPIHLIRITGIERWLRYYFEEQIWLLGRPILIRQPDFFKPKYFKHAGLSSRTRYQVGNILPVGFALLLGRHVPYFRFNRFCRVQHNKLWSRLKYPDRPRSSFFLFFYFSSFFYKILFTFLSFFRGGRWHSSLEQAFSRTCYRSYK